MNIYKANSVGKLRDLMRRTALSPYEQWIQSEGIPIYLVYGGADLRQITELGEWKRMGAKGAFLIQPDTWKGMCDAYICEIPPGGNTAVQRHLYEEVVLVMSGTGATSIYHEGKEQTFEWSEGDYFVIPLNVAFQHFNTTDESTRFLALTAAPLVWNYFHDHDFIFKNPYSFTSRFRGEEDYFNPSATRTYRGQTLGHVMEANFVRDIINVGLAPRPERGKASTNLYFQGGESTLIAHASEMPVGSYKKAHRHLATGWFGLILKGRGFTLAWKEDSRHYSKASDRRRYDWHDWCVLGYPDPYYHQHFNTSSGPSRYFAIHFGSQKFPGLVWVDHWKVQVSQQEGGDQVEYRDEDPVVFEMFKEELDKHGVPLAPVETWRA